MVFSSLCADPMKEVVRATHISLRARGRSRDSPCITYSLIDTSDSEESKLIFTLEVNEASEEVEAKDAHGSVVFSANSALNRLEGTMHAHYACASGNQYLGSVNAQSIIDAAEDKHSSRQIHLTASCTELSEARTFSHNPNQTPRVPAVFSLSNNSVLLQLSGRTGLYTIRQTMLMIIFMVKLCYGEYGLDRQPIPCGILSRLPAVKRVEPSLMSVAGTHLVFRSASFSPSKDNSFYMDVLSVPSYRIVLVVKHDATTNETCIFDECGIKQASLKHNIRNNNLYAYSHDGALLGHYNLKDHLYYNHLDSLQHNRPTMHLAYRSNEFVVSSAKTNCSIASIRGTHSPAQPTQVELMYMAGPDACLKSRVLIFATAVQLAMKYYRLPLQSLPRWEYQFRDLLA